MDQYGVLLALTRLGIGHGNIETIREVDWRVIQGLAYKQGLSAIILDGIDKLPEALRPQKELTLKWVGEILQNYEQLYVQYQNSLFEMVSFYGSHGLKIMVLKGYACSLDWPKPNHRPCGDIDIWQFGKQKEADDLIEKEKKIRVDASHHHHTIFNWGDFIVENHYDFIDIHHRKSGVKLEALFKQLGEDDSHYVDLNGEKLYMPSPKLHALFLVYHTMLHFTSTEMTIRQILDWGFFVERHNKEVDWEWLQRMLNEYHLVEFFNILNAICVDDLGFDTAIFPYIQFNPNLKDRILKDTFNPEFNEKEPSNVIRRFFFRYRRWKSHEWKHKLCYKESMASIFMSAVWSHLLKPSTI